MNKIIGILALAALMQFLYLPCAAIAGNQVPTEKEIMQAEDEPPLIPHRVADDATFRDCLKCHGSGKNGAMMTSHPERRNCTQCHIPGKVKARAAKAGKKKK